MATRKTYKKEDLDKFVEDNNIELIGEYEKIKKTTRIEGKCKTLDCNNYFDKQFYQIMQVSGPYCKICTKNNTIEKRKKTNLEKYGVENPSQLNEIKEKKIKTCIENIGVRHPQQ